ncbi:MAG TPA: DUF1800 domain-containing protein [Acidobacteriaceae bacterium]|jgi:uncharacterized protein (DUF1800 family)|nr:DUF1800 domain-containing protein [Acidobacteriaceae bacterium]
MSGSSNRFASRLAYSLRPCAAAVLSLILSIQPGWAQIEQAQTQLAPTRAGQTQSVHSGLLQDEEKTPSAAPDAAISKSVSIKLGAPKIDPNQTTSDPHILHLLSRFTFGPTPEDVASVRALGKNGIEKWFDQQLRPDDLRPTADDLMLAGRLADFPELQLQPDELLMQFPSGAIIRQTANGKLAIPNDPNLYAIYRRHIRLYEDKQAKKEKDQGKPESPVKAEGATPQTAETAVSADAGSSSPSSNLSPSKMPDTARPAYSDLLVKSVLALPPSQRLQRILNMRPAEFEEFQANTRGGRRAPVLQGMTPKERELLSDFENPTHTVIEALQAQRLLRDIYSSNQLEEVMTTFWLNHFNVYLHKNEETPYYLVSYERDAIRPRALGNFEDLLDATALSPAMLLYLDNSSSTGPDSIVAQRQKERAAEGKPAKATAPGLNENYGRELMELHTLGVNGGYTQTDVTEVAKIFTGWTVDRPQLGGDFKFDETRHEPGAKTVLGHKIKANGPKEGFELLHILANSPATAHFISQELAVAFVSDNPPQVLVDRMAHEFLKTHGEISAVLRVLLRSPEFWNPATYQAKVKTPLEYVVSAARASSAEIVNVHPLVEALNQMGMPLYSCVPPTGYSDKADAWVSTGELVTRMNFALSLATNHFGGIRSQWTPAFLQLTNPAEIEQLLENRLIPAGVSDKTRAAVLEQAQTQTQPQPQTQVFPPSAENPPSKITQQLQRAREQQNAQIAGLLLGSPEFQRR